MGRKTCRGDFMKRAFTFLEVIVLIAILGIVLSIALIKFDTINQNLEEMEVKKVCSTLRSARAYSLKRRSNVVVSLYENSLKASSKDREFINLKLKKLKINTNLKDSKIEFKISSFSANAGSIILSGNKKYKITIPVATGKITYRGVVE